MEVVKVFDRFPQGGDFWLTEFLAAAKIDAGLFPWTEHVANWPCRMAPVCKTPLEAIRNMATRRPFHSPLSASAPVHEPLSSEAVIGIIKDPEWEFDRPKLGMTSGFGKPGAPLVHPDNLELIESPTEVLKESTKVLNLQMFHRGQSERTGTETEAPSALTKKELKQRRKKMAKAVGVGNQVRRSANETLEAFPIHAERMRWPCHEVFDFDFRNSMLGPNRPRKEPKLESASLAGRTASRAEVDAIFGTSVSEESEEDENVLFCQQLREEEAEGVRNDDWNSGEVVDVATRFSRRGATTWWHLDDGGEFVTQTALSHSADGVAELDGANTIMVGPHGLPIVKMFIYLPREYYDLVTQDAETFETGVFKGLDILSTPMDSLLDFDDLPTLDVCLLEAGGEPITSPPNIPHIVFTLNSCVMVEQRRVSKLFLEETCYFNTRSSTWAGECVAYQFIHHKLKDVQYVHKNVVLPLISIIAAGEEFFRPVVSPNAPLDSAKWGLGPFVPISGHNTPEEKREYVLWLQTLAFVSLETLLNSKRLTRMQDTTRKMITTALCNIPEEIKHNIHYKIGEIQRGLPQKIIQQAAKGVLAVVPRVQTQAVFDALLGKKIERIPEGDAKFYTYRHLESCVVIGKSYVTEEEAKADLRSQRRGN